MSLLKEFNSYILRENLFSPTDKLLLAVSGGMDSVVLCELCHLAGYDFIIAHCNFQLRGEESERDEAFVRSLGKKYDKEVLVKKFDTGAYASQYKVSIQVAARELRYKWFFEIVNRRPSVGSGESGVRSREFGVGSRGAGAGSQTSGLTTPDSELKTPNSKLPTPNCVATAHHADDNIETLLMNFFKGTGITGLRGMLPKQEKLVRPLLFAHREALNDFATTHQLNWVEDSSNASDKYTRNYFRHQVVPLLEKIYPGLEKNLTANLQRFREAAQLYTQAIDIHKKKLMEQKGEEVHIPVLKLKKSAPLATIVYEITRAYHFGPLQVNDIIALLDAESGKYVSSSTHRVIKNRNWLIIAPLTPADAATILIESAGTVESSIGNIDIAVMPNTPGTIPGSPDIAWLDADKISFPLLLRKWKQGDYFYPLGMRKKKKLSRFFIDQKLSKTGKEKIWVLEMNKKIIWIPGLRIDDRFKIEPSTKRVMKLELRRVSDQ